MTTSQLIWTAAGCFGSFVAGLTTGLLITRGAYQQGRADERQDWFKARDHD